MQQKLIALAGTIRTNLIEICLTLLVLVGLPMVALWYVDLRLAASTFIVFAICFSILGIYIKESK